MSEQLPPDEIADERAELKRVRERLGKKLGWNCDEWGCSNTAKDGAVYRVNPKGRPGIFMCSEHRNMIESVHQ